MWKEGKKSVPICKQKTTKLITCLKEKIVDNS
jgi:hypothetical protein